MTVATDSAGEPFTPGSAQARASDDVIYATTGTARPGFIQFSIEFVYLHNGGPADVLLTDGVHRYDYAPGSGPTPPSHCAIEDCEYSATLPFDLGSRFDISASGNSDWFTGIPGGVASDAIVTSMLFGEHGKMPVPFFVTPEPSTFGLLLLGSAAGAWFLFKRRSHQ